MSLLKLIVPFILALTISTALTANGLRSALSDEAPKEVIRAIKDGSANDLDSDLGGLTDEEVQLVLNRLPDAIVADRRAFEERYRQLPEKEKDRAEGQYREDQKKLRERILQISKERVLRERRKPKVEKLPPNIAIPVDAPEHLKAYLEKAKEVRRARSLYLRSLGALDFDQRNAAMADWNNSNARKVAELEASRVQLFETMRQEAAARSASKTLSEEDHRQREEIRALQQEFIAADAEERGQLISRLLELRTEISPSE